MNSKDCLFCKIISGAIPSPRVYEDEDFICFRDIRPQAKTHLLLVPKDHCPSIDEIRDQAWASKYLQTIAKVAREQGLLAGGYRAVTNTGANAGQTVFHVHFHILGGEELSGSFGV